MAYELIGEVAIRDGLTLGRGPSSELPRLSQGVGRSLLLEGDFEFVGGIAFQGEAGQEVAFNDDGLDVDFRIEGDTDANLFTLDAGLDAVGIGGVPATSVKFGVDSTTGAFRLPRMTTAQRDALTAVNGMLIYNTTTVQVERHNGTAWASVGVTDHGALSGLADDDHTQYLLADGSRGLSANWDAGTFEVRANTFQSDVATGTAPLIVASTTLVTNLNADTVDGVQESAFYLADGTRAISGDINHDGTNIGFFGTTPANQGGSTEDIKDWLITIFGGLGGATPLDLDGGTLTCGALTMTGLLATPTSTVDATAAATFENTADAATVRVMDLEGDRATPTDNDGIMQGFFLSNDIGGRDEFGRITVRAVDVTSTSKDSKVEISGYVTNSFVTLFAVGQLNAAGSFAFGFNGTESARQTYTSTTQNARDADAATTVGPLQDVVQTLIADLRAHGMVL